MQINIDANLTTTQTLEFTHESQNEVTYMYSSVTLLPLLALYS